MKFSEAMAALEDGKLVRCVSWDQRKFWGRTSDKCSEYTEWTDCKYRVDRMMDEEWELHEEPDERDDFLEEFWGRKDATTLIPQEGEHYFLMGITLYHHWLKKKDADRKDTK